MASKWRCLGNIIRIDHGPNGFRAACFGRLSIGCGYCRAMEVALTVSSWTQSLRMPFVHEKCIWHAPKTDCRNAAVGKGPESKPNVENEARWIFHAS